VVVVVVALAVIVAVSSFVIVFSISLTPTLPFYLWNRRHRSVGEGYSTLICIQTENALTPIAFDARTMHVCCA
jgi:uncharacterized membrane protein